MITYYLATDKVDVFHYGQKLEGMEVSTGQPNLFFYNTKEELITALELYGQQYQEPTMIEDAPIEPSIPLG
tara:strand:- start:150 stop:362 length:213 start_codon:yes stop_codon:yes gene_type:complete